MVIIILNEFPQLLWIALAQTHSNKRIIKIDIQNQSDDNNHLNGLSYS